MTVLLATIAALQFKPKAIAIHAKTKAMAMGQVETSDYLAKRSAANNKFRKWFAAAKTLSVDMNIAQSDNGSPGKATLILERPDKLYYHLKWGNDDYTFTIDHGKATEIDLGQKSYDEYDVPGWTGPEANASDWMASYFPSIFINESNLLPPGCFDAEGRVSSFAVGSSDEKGLHKNVVTFSNYKINIPIPDSRFQQTIPVGLEVYGTPRPAPPIQIGSMLPNITLVSSKGTKTTLVQALSGRPALVACLDPQCAPSMASLNVLKKLGKPAVIILSTGLKTGGIKTANLPVYHDPTGKLASEMRMPMSPVYYLVGPLGKVANVWYGFDRDHPSKFSAQIKEAVQGDHS